MLSDQIAKEEYNATKNAQMAAEGKMTEINEAISMHTLALTNKRMTANEFYFGPQLLEACQQQGLTFAHIRLEPSQLLIGRPHVVYAYSALKVSW